MRMTPCAIPFLLLVAAALNSPPPLAAQQVQVESFVLENGMEFLLVPRTDQPNVIRCGWVAKVGSVNERPGITGISHFFEHMMFKGTNRIGTKDAAKDAEFRKRQEDVRGALRDGHLEVQYDRWRKGEIDDPWDPKNDTAEMAALRDELKKLMDQQGAITVKNEFDKIYTNLGGSDMNAFTDYDLTFYFITVPSNKFELWAWMESDRLTDSVFREFYEERDVVHEERRLRTESTPTGIFEEQFDALFWQSSPYSWPVIGWTSDLNSYTRAQAEEYFKTYYCPNNLVGVIVGDFQTAAVKPLVSRYFGRLARGAEPPPVVTLEMPQLAAVRMEAECDCQPQIEIRYHTVPFDHPNEAALELMAEILNGRTGRLYKSMVEGKEIAATASASQQSRKFGGYLSFRAECKGEATPEELEAAWYEEVERLQTELVLDRELEKVKNRSLADAYRNLEDDFFVMLRLGYYEALGGWEYINDAPKRLQAVTAGDIKEVANEFLKRTNSAVAIYRRKAGSGGEAEDPDLAGLPPEVRQRARQMLAQLALSEVQDPSELREFIRQAEAQDLAAMPPEMRLLRDVLIKKASARVAELESNNTSEKKD
ncbi:MAG: insulinase family protein [Planctomycetes bacterium]|nr:insulinase family protein [Planctomycetota bacterium]